jgi:hypothetical protein
MLHPSASATSEAAAGAFPERYGHENQDINIYFEIQVPWGKPLKLGVIHSRILMPRSSRTHIIPLSMKMGCQVASCGGCGLETRKPLIVARKKLRKMKALGKGLLGHAEEGIALRRRMKTEKRRAGCHKTLICQPVNRRTDENRRRKSQCR